MPETNGLEYNSLFNDPAEAFVCALHQRGAEDYINKGILSDGFALLTDERLYIKGTYFLHTGSSYTRMADEQTIDVDSIADMEIVYYNPLRYMAAAIALLIVAYASIMLGVSGIKFFLTTFSITVSIVFIIIVFLLSVIYSVNRRMLFEFTFYGGSALAFKYELLNDDEIKEFKSSVELIRNTIKRSPDDISLTENDTALPHSIANTENGNGINFSANSNESISGYTSNNDISAKQPAFNSELNFKSANDDADNTINSFTSKSADDVTTDTANNITEDNDFLRDYKSDFLSDSEVDFQNNGELETAETA